MDKIILLLCFMSTLVFAGGSTGKARESKKDLVRNLPKNAKIIKYLGSSVNDLDHYFLVKFSGYCFIVDDETSFLYGMMTNVPCEPIKRDTVYIRTEIPSSPSSTLARDDWNF